MSIHVHLHVHMYMHMHTHMHMYNVYSYSYSCTVVCLQFSFTVNASLVYSFVYSSHRPFAPPPKMQSRPGDRYILRKSCMRQALIGRVADQRGCIVDLSLADAGTTKHFFWSHARDPAHGERGTAHHLTQHTSAYVSGRGFPTLPTQPPRRTPPPITWQRAAGARSQGPRLCASPPVEMKTPGTARMDRNRVFSVPAHIPELADDHLSNLGPSGRHPHN